MKTKVNDNKIQKEFRRIVEENSIKNKEVECNRIARGNENRKNFSNIKKSFTEHKMEFPSDEYALAKGEEALVRCRVGNGYGDAFTNKPIPFKGKLEEIPELLNNDPGKRAIFFSTLNATLNDLKIIEDTIHCEKGNPKKCGEILADKIHEEYENPKVAHIGYQPGHLKACTDLFDSFVTDLNQDNIGKQKHGEVIIDGRRNEEIIKKVDVACITGSTVVNGTLYQLLKWCKEYGTKPIIYGVTAKGIAKIMDLSFFCPLGKEKN